MTKRNALQANKSSESLAGLTTCIDRRTFLSRSVAGGVALPVMGGALSLLAAGCAARTRYASATVVDGRLAVPLADLASGALLVEDPRTDLPIYLRRTATGTYTAVSTRCMHRGCQVEPVAAKLVCPCHGSEYTFEGALLQGPAQRPLTRYRVTSDERNVYIDHSATELR